MNTVTLGKTGITVSKAGFGALPIQRIPAEEAVKLLRKAFARGIQFYDTARAYTDSEEKIGLALADVRNRIVLATKSHAESPAELRKQLEASLACLRTDHVDLYQFHMASRCYRPGDGTGMYETMQELKAEGKIRHIGITAHLLHVAQEAVSSGLYETLQYPFSYLSGEQEIALVRECGKRGMGFIAMKALAGGLITNIRAAVAFQNRFAQVIPIWGIQREAELDELIVCAEQPPTLSAEMQREIEKDREELAGEFCRGCGYCMPCPAGIEIRTCARMSLLLRRSPSQGYLEKAGQEKMKKIEGCLHCGRCREKCPYGLDTPALLERNYEDYKRVLAGEVKV